MIIFKNTTKNYFSPLFFKTYFKGIIEGKMKLLKKTVL